MFSSCEENRRQESGFVPQGACDYPCDITLTVQNGKEVKAHRRILAEASPFFQKLLSSDMKEAREGVVRLNMMTEPVLGDILEFIYTGCVQISEADRAQELIAMADYLVLPQLKSLAGSALTQRINASNCLSMYHFGKVYQCKEVVAGTQKFIFANFSAVATTEDFLNMSSDDVKMWTSCDDIGLSTREDVYQFIANWIDHDEVERKKYFSELFCHVQGRLQRQFVRRFMLQFLRRF